MYPVTLWTLENGKVDYVQIKNSRVIHIWCYNCHHLEVYVGGVGGGVKNRMGKESEATSGSPKLVLPYQNGWTSSQRS